MFLPQFPFHVHYKVISPPALGTLPLDLDKPPYDEVLGDSGRRMRLAPAPG